MDYFPLFLQHPDVVQQPDRHGEAKAWCPWHADKGSDRPNLGINVEKRIVKCHSCGEGGIKALAKAWGISGRPKDSTPMSIEQTYDYRRADGQLLFQVVRLHPKEFLQRRPDPAKPGDWLWDTKGIQTVLYRLPELRAAPGDEWVWLVEGEKDADRLQRAGLVSTTAPGGATRRASKWKAQYTRELTGRLVAIIPDNDEVGELQGQGIATSLHGQAATVKIVHLPDLPPDGDVSDYLDAGHSADDLRELLAHALPFHPGEDDAVAEHDATPLPWQNVRFLPFAQEVTTRLKAHGYFVNGGLDAYYFDQEYRTLVPLDDKDEQQLRILLGERYRVNARDTFYGYLLEHLLLEAHVRGHHSLVRKFSYYDQDDDLVYLDMGAGRVLRISAQAMEVRDNGVDGVLFLPVPDQEPWEYNSRAPSRMLYETLVEKVNFTDEGSELGVKHQRMLLLLWLLSMAFESVMPTKVIAMAIGPGGSGKTSLLRSCGQLLIGPGFDVDSLSQDQARGEDDFWINVGSGFLIAYDNVDQPVRWLPDALAQVATGVRKSRRQLFTTTSVNRTKIAAMLAVTSRTPTASLRREDVSDRSLVFTLRRLEEKRSEHELQETINRNRADLMSDYARLVQRALTVSWDEAPVADPGMRMADFARVATRIGHGQGPEAAELTDEVISRIRLSQNRFSTEEDILTTLLQTWLSRTAPTDEGGMDLGAVSNEGRVMGTGELLLELNAIAREFDLRFKPGTPTALGRRMQNMEASFQQLFEVKRSHTRHGSTWQFQWASPDEENE